ncbi:uncharacterized protein LOC141616985 [Silene latifolia]|uniref:uncharacterized protein LOC141616985 n=1 Tax=Silene latifolia TaxID=37657 RepID=UPI003D77E09D
MPKDVSVDRIPDLIINASDHKRIVSPYHDPLILDLKISAHTLRRCLIDTGAYTNLLYRPTSEQLGLGPQHPKPTSGAPYGFSGEASAPMGTIMLPVRFGRGTQSRRVQATFTVIDAESAYNSLIGRQTLGEINAVMSVRGLILVYMSDVGRTKKLHGNQISSRSCNVTAFKQTSSAKTRGEPNPGTAGSNSCREVQKSFKRPTSEAEASTSKGKSTDHKRPVSGVGTTNVYLGPGRSVIIGEDMSPTFKDQMIGVLKRNMDIFAYSTDEISGVSEEVIVHKLNEDPTSKPVKRKKMNMSTEQKATIKEEVDKLLFA